MRTGKRGFGATIALSAALAVLAAPSSAGAAVTLGSDLTKPISFGGGGDPHMAVPVAIPGRMTQAPFDGVITRWRIRGSGADWGTVRLRVARQVAPGTYTGAGTSMAQAVGAVFTTLEFPTTLQIKAGDFIGLNATSQWQGAADQPGVVTHLVLTPPDGGPPSGSPIVQDEEVFFNADVEPDCDGDGLGDDTQDPDTSACNPDTAAPETTFTRVPKNKVKTFSRRADVLFEFVSSEPGSTFGCSLDGKAFTPCDSPHVFKVKAKRRKAKRHGFEVRATDAAGNVDPTPATDQFKVKRKR
jgi:hypothetical protein